MVAGGHGGVVRSIDEILAEARARLRRLGPQEANEAIGAGALLVDIRSQAQRAEQGLVPGALHVERNVLEWRADGTSGVGDDRLVGKHLIVMCAEGYSSSLAAATLQQIGIAGATDMIGGFEAWQAAGLPVEPCPD